ncbi:hypothetical protein KJ813_07480 [bacterium]|nr:hypothetical protein [bacterium]
MGIADDIKGLTNEVVFSYESRISEVGIIIDNTYRILEEFKTKRNEMSNQLKENLAKEGSLRKKDFDSMMVEILSRQDEREKQVKDLLRTFLEEQKEAAQTIKKNLAEGEKVRIIDFKKILQDIQARQKGGENEVNMMLKEFQKEHKEMAESLRTLLDKGEVLRIKDFKEMVKNIRSRQIERTNEVREKLDEFRKERQEMASEWHKLTIAMAKKRADSLKGGESREKEEITNS